MNISMHGLKSNTAVWVLHSFAGVALVACGGRAVDNDLSPEGQEAQPQQSEDAADDNESSQDAPNVHRLGDCKGGSMLGEGLCPWLDPDSNLCFPTKEDSCSCICPQDRDSVCVSGFFGGEDGQTPVYCN